MKVMKMLDAKREVADFMEKVHSGVFTSREQEAIKTVSAKLRRQHQREHGKIIGRSAIVFRG